MYKVIIVDDDIFPAKLLQEYMKEYVEGFKVEEILSDGTDAVKYLSEHKDISVVITDIKMKNMSGLQLAQYIYTMKLNIEVVLVSAYSEFEYAKEALNYGVFGYLLKAIDVDELVDMMSKLKRKLDSGNDIKDIKIQREYFIESLLVKRFKNKRDMNTEFQKCGFHCSADDLVCTIFTVTFDEIFDLEKITDAEGSDKLAAELEGVTACAFNKSCTMCITQENKTFYMSFIDADTQFSAEKLENIISDIFDTSVTVEVIIQADFEEMLESENMLQTLMENRTNGEESDFGKETVIRKALSYIDNNFSGDISREVVAKYVGYTPAYFGKIFKEITGNSYFDYVYKAKMNYAKELLEKGMKTSEVCSKIGYSDERHFRRTFRNYVGITPAEYRQNNRKNGEAGD